MPKVISGARQIVEGREYEVKRPKRRGFPLFRGNEREVVERAVERSLAKKMRYRQSYMD